MRLLHPKIKINSNFKKTFEQNKTKLTNKKYIKIKNISSFKLFIFFLSTFLNEFCEVFYFLNWRRIKVLTFHSKNVLCDTVPHSKAEFSFLKVKTKIFWPGRFYKTPLQFLLNLHTKKRKNREKKMKKDESE